MKRVAALLCLLLLATGCGATSDEALRTAENALDRADRLATPTPTPTPGPPVECEDPTASLRPPSRLPAPGRMPAKSTMRRIQERGRLIAGVDQNTFRFAFLNPQNGEIEGLEIDILREIARALLGDPTAVELKAISTAQRIPFVEDGSVDLVADGLTITCGRARLVNFSTVYYEAGQRVLVPRDSAVRSLDDLGGQRVCATAGSTTIDTVRRWRSRPVAYPVAQRTDCLVLLQQGVVDAISSDDAILLGFAAQDPYTKLVGPRISREPYGIAIPREHRDMVRFVNGVLEEMREDGRMRRIYERWLRGTNSRSEPPAPRYRD